MRHYFLSAAAHESSAGLLSLLAVVFLLPGCTSTPALMPPPNSIVYSQHYPDESVAEPYRSSLIDILYVTDRAAAADQNGKLVYGSERSPSMAYGSAKVEIGENLAWSRLVELSTSPVYTKKQRYTMLGRTELGRFPATPYPFSMVNSRPVLFPATQHQIDQVSTQLKSEISQRLKLGDKKEIVLFIHGYNNSFDDSIFTLAGLWHFLGRQGVPLVYSWPAAHGGMFGYFVDRESGEYTIYHLKETLRILFSIPDIQKIHIIAHSRGTDVTTTALRELMIEARAKGENPALSFRVANLILAAADLDFGVISQRLMAEKFGAAIGQINVYTTQSDKALGFAQGLMSGTRFGRVRPEDLSSDEKDIFAGVGNVHIIEIEDVSSYLGHGYFHNNPAVSSDLLNIIREGALPGSKLRPLTPKGGNFWYLPADYPR